MFIQRIFLGIFAIPLIASLWVDKKKTIIPPQAHLPPTEESAGPLEQMLQDIPCKEGKGVRATILYEKGLIETCVPSARPIEI